MSDLGPHGSPHSAPTSDALSAEASSVEKERLRRWRLLLGEASAEPLGTLGAHDAGVDAAMAAIYDAPPADGPRAGGLGASNPQLLRWLGDIRSYFPQRVVQVMQRDAVTRLGVHRLLLEPELLGSVEPDVRLVGTLLSLKSAIPEQTRATARTVVRHVVGEIEQRLANRLRSAVAGALNRATRTHRPRPRDIDWNSTIKANLAHYLPQERTIVPHRLIGYGRQHRALGKEVVLAIDQSGSMASSVVYAAVFGSVLASLRTLKTSVVVFDTAVVDLTDRLGDPVDLLFATQLGGGTDINRAVRYCQSLFSRPRDGVFVLISDLYEGGVREELLARMRRLRTDGVAVVVLLALSDDGAPSYDRDLAAELVESGVPAFACTPDAFPDLLAAALAGDDLQAWVEREQSARRRR